jgi:hypothetical protein
LVCWGNDDDGSAGSVSSSVADVKDDPEEKVVGGGGKADNARDERDREGITIKVATITF